MNQTSKILALALQAIFLSTPAFATPESDGVVADGGCMKDDVIDDSNDCLAGGTHDATKPWKDPPRPSSPTPTPAPENAPQTQQDAGGDPAAAGDEGIEASDESEGLTDEIESSDAEDSGESASSGTEEK